ncbi:MAG: multidrug effflux MFS transporter [Streptosporangiaceae bacterium]
MATDRSERPVSATTRVPVRRVVVLGGLTALAPLSVDMYLPALPSVTRTLASSAAAVQLTLTACLVGLAAGQLLAGPVSDVLGRRPPLLVGLAGYTVASLLCAVAPTVWVLIALRLAQGLCGAAGVVIARSVVRDLRSGTAAARLFAFLMLVTGFAPVLAPTLGAGLLRATTWRGVFVVLTALGLLLLIVSAVGLPESLPAERRRPPGLTAMGRTFRHLLRDRAFVGYALAGGLAFATMFAYISGSPFVLQHIYGLSPQLFGAVFGVNAAGIVAASQTSALLVKRLGPRPLLRIGLGAVATGGAAVLTVILLGLGLPGLLPALFLAVSGVGLVLPNSTALALTDHPDVAGSASALLGTGQFLIGGLTAPLVGLAGAGSALPMGVVMAAVGIAAMVVFATFTRSEAR